MLLGGVVTGLTVVAAPPPLQPPRTAISTSAAPHPRAGAACDSGPTGDIGSPGSGGRPATDLRVMAALPYWPGQAAADSWNTCFKR